MPQPRPTGSRFISPAKAEATVPPDLIGAWAATDGRLDAATLFRLPTGSAPEDVAVDHDGRLMPIVEKLLPHPGVRRMVALLPEGVQPKPVRYGLVALVNGDGEVLRTLHGPSGGYSMITGVRQHETTLWLGSLAERAVARVELS